MAGGGAGWVGTHGVPMWPVGILGCGGVMWRGRVWVPGECSGSAIPAGSMVARSEWDVSWSPQCIRWSPKCRRWRRVRRDGEGVAPCASARLVPFRECSHQRFLALAFRQRTRYRVTNDADCGPCSLSCARRTPCRSRLPSPVRTRLCLYLIPRRRRWASSGWPLCCWRRTTCC